jgi:hypothetical protein
MISDLDLLTEITGYPINDETDPVSIKTYKRITIQVPKTSKITLDGFRAALKTLVTGGGI